MSGMIWEAALSWSAVIHQKPPPLSSVTAPTLPVWAKVSRTALYKITLPISAMTTDPAATWPSALLLLAKVDAAPAESGPENANTNGDVMRASKPRTAVVTIDAFSVIVGVPTSDRMMAPYWVDIKLRAAKFAWRVVNDIVSVKALVSVIVMPVIVPASA